ncbi:MAG: hypothetical protein JXR56_09925 [Candidatus Cloacimonetes bacterium]|nr:hypothetical protein [Candidatus Cloacimonadota bacterium]
MSKKGSKKRCLRLTGLTSFKEELNKIINLGDALKIEIKPEHEFYPQGYKNPTELQLNKCKLKTLAVGKAKELQDWWLIKSGTTPVWDIVCEAEINGQAGLILVEAKAHKIELHEQDKSDAKELNRTQIKKALKEVNSIFPDCNLSVDSHYQLANRFAWSWKLAEMGIPVVLIYLGFLNVEEWKDRFKDHEDWENILKNYNQTTVPNKYWGTEIKTNKASFYPIIRSYEI